MKLLPIWRFTHTLPSHKDSESATVIEQTYKLYQTMQELITECNEFSENVNNKIIEFVTKYEEDIDTFTTSFRQEYQDFIDVVELKLENQDKRIQEIGQTVLEYIQPTIDEFLTAIENNLREELLTLINENVTPQIQTIDNKLMWINDSIDCLTTTQVEHTTKLAELDYKKADKEAVSDLEQVIIPRIETSLNETNTRVSDLEQVTIPRIEEDIESLKGGTGNVEPDNVLHVSEEHIEFYLEDGVRKARINIQDSDIYKTIDFYYYDVESLFNDNQIDTLVIPLKLGQQIIIECDTMPFYIEFDFTENEIGCPLKPDMPYYKVSGRFHKVIDSISSSYAIFESQIAESGCSRFSLERDTRLNGNCFLVEDIGFTEY